MHTQHRALGTQPNGMKQFPFIHRGASPLINPIHPNHVPIIHIIPAGECVREMDADAADDDDDDDAYDDEVVVAAVREPESESERERESESERGSERKEEDILYVCL